MHQPATKFHPAPADDQRVLSLFRDRIATRRLTRLIRQGVGVREASWEFAADDPRRLAREMLEWIQESMGAMRRPYGIDHVAVAFALRDAQGNVQCSNALGVMRPADFYGIEGKERIEAFLRDARYAGAGEGARVVGALLSLGDVAYEMGIPRAA